VSPRVLGKLAGAVILTTVLVLAVSACGGSDASDTGSAPSAQSGSSGQRPQFDPDSFAQLRECLEEHGVTLPSPGQQGAPPSGRQGTPPALDEDAQEALEACSEYLPSRAPGQGGSNFG
jgi:hypothetical protein